MTDARSRFIQKLNPSGPCPCGSGSTYAECHMAADHGIPVRPMSDSAMRLLQIAEAKEELRKMQQGLGKPIISAQVGDQRFVAVGNEVINSKNFKTFHDFLNQYLRYKMGQEWLAKEAKSPAGDRHPMMVWYEKMRDVQRAHEVGVGEIYSVVLTGAMSAYMRLSYNLYLLQHNVVLQERLLQRLRQKDQFHPAFYETLIAAAFIKAGFQLELEREDDPTRKHCEFTATSPTSGKKFSVEAKMRKPGKEDANVRNQLYNALLKTADHQRIACIELSYPGGVGSDVRQRFAEAAQSIMNAQARLTIAGAPAPSTYVILTNHPWVLDLDGEAGAPAYAGQAFKLDGFQFDSGKQTLQALVSDREQHRDMYHLLESMHKHQEIPTTFDGDMAELAFATEPVGRLVIGQRYVDLDLGAGTRGDGVLEDAVVVEPEKTAMCIFRTDDGRRVMIKAPMTDAELRAYERYPEVFFGQHSPQMKGDRPVDFFDWMHGTYSQSTKEMLRELMRGWPNQQRLASMNQAELAREYSLRIADTAMQRIQRARGS